MIIENNKIIADSGKTFRRIHDQFLMSSDIYLGNDYSTGIERIDLPEYYEEIDEIINTDELLKNNL